MPATRLVQIKLPLKEHRALVSEAKRAGRTLTGHVRLVLSEQSNHRQISTRLFTLLIKVANSLVSQMGRTQTFGVVGQEDNEAIMKKLERELENLLKATC